MNQVEMTFQSFGTALNREQMKKIKGGELADLPAPFTPGPNDAGCFGGPCNPYINCCDGGQWCDSSGHCGHA